MKKNVLIIALSLFFTTPIFSQNSPKELLDQVSNYYRNSGNFYLKFESTLSNSSTGNKDDYTGEVYVSKEKYNLSIPKLDLNQIYDGKKLYTISKETEEVTITSPAPNSDDLFTPTRVFDIYKNGYKFDWGADTTVNGVNAKVIKLTPTKNSETKEVLVAVDKNSKKLLQITEVTKNNTETNIRVTKQIQGVIVPSALLKFNKKAYPNYYISEL